MGLGARGRLEMRTLKVVSVGHFGFPHAAQILQITRKRRVLDASARRFKTVTGYAVTQPPFELARPARLADLLGGHWAIEALHHVVIGVLSGAGPVNLAALGHHARDPARPLATLGITLGGSHPTQPVREEAGAWASR